MTGHRQAGLRAPNTVTTSTSGPVQFVRTPPPIVPIRVVAYTPQGGSIDISALLESLGLVIGYGPGNYSLPRPDEKPWTPPKARKRPGPAKPAKRPTTSRPRR